MIFVEQVTYVNRLFPAMDKLVSCKGQFHWMSLSELINKTNIMSKSEDLDVSQYFDNHGIIRFITSFVIGRGNMQIMQFDSVTILGFNGLLSL